MNGFVYRRLIMSNKILLAIAFTCVVSSYNIISAVVSTEYKTNTTKIRESKCQIFEKKINENIVQINREIDELFNKYSNSELRFYTPKSKALLDKLFIDISIILSSIRSHNKGKHKKTNECVLPKNMISEIIKCYELLMKLSQIFNEIVTYNRKIINNCSQNWNGKLIIQYEKQAKGMQQIIDKLQELNVSLIEYSNVDNYISNKYIHLKNILELVNNETVSLQRKMIQTLQDKVNKYNFKYSYDNKKTKNYHNNLDENNTMTRGNKKYIKYNIDPFDINNFDANNINDEFKTCNRDNLQNNAFKEWTPNDKYDNLDIQNEIDIADRNYNIQNSVVQDMYNNIETNINNNIYNIKYLRNNNKFQ